MQEPGKVLSKTNSFYSNCNLLKIITAENTVLSGNPTTIYPVVVTPPTTHPTSKEMCKKGGWMTLLDSKGNHFKNQGACVSFVEKSKEKHSDHEHDKDHKDGKESKNKSGR